MSIYTDYLNAHQDMGYKAFAKLCAWNAASLKPFKPATITPEFPVLNQDEVVALNNELDLAMDKLQDLEAMTATEQQNMRDDAFDTIEDEHWRKIEELERLISVYGEMLSDLCRWNPVDKDMQNLKAFAIKELTSNMPNLSKYSQSPVEPAVSTFIESKRKEYNAEVSRITKQITEKSKTILAATEYINKVNTELSDTEEE